jgi:hypothetical protein
MMRVLVARPPDVSWLFVAIGCLVTRKSPLQG